jgi:hypothetical protein
MALMLAPSIQGYFEIIPVRALNGDFAEYEKPYLGIESWFNGDYQSDMVPYIEQKTGFHNTLVRLHNQMDYSLFGKPSAEGVVRGKNGQLYEYDYIRAWNGKDFIGENFHDKKLRNFKFLQQYLKDSLDIDLILVLEPGKASVCPEDIPERYQRERGENTNYNYILDRSSELGIRLIDFNQYFIDIKDTIDHPLFPKYGTHWSEFAMWYAADSLLNYIEYIRSIKMPRVIRVGTEISKELRSTDYDVGASLNLIWNLPHDPMPYPEYHFSDTNSLQKPMVLAVADSYYWNIFNTRIPKHIFANEAFWYFYKMVYPDTYFGEKMVDDLDLQKEIEKQDVIFLMVTERFLYKFDWGFTDDLFAIYGRTSLLDRLSGYKQDMVLADDWFRNIIYKANTRGISLGEMMDLDARYMLRTEDPYAHFSLLGPSSLVSEIRQNEKWYESVRRNAVIKDIPINEQILEEAEFLINKEYPEALATYYKLTEIKDSILKDSLLSLELKKNMGYYYMTEEEMLQVMAEEMFSQDTTLTP